MKDKEVSHTAVHGVEKSDRTLEDTAYLNLNNLSNTVCLVCDYDHLLYSSNWVIPVNERNKLLKTQNSIHGEFPKRLFLCKCL